MLIEHMKETAREHMAIIKHHLKLYKENRSLLRKLEKDNQSARRE